MSNDLTNPRWLGELAAPPAPPVYGGDEYFHIGESQLYKYIGGGWVPIARGAAPRGVSIAGLPARATPAGTDILPLVADGNNFHATVVNLTKGMAPATTSEQGVMSAADKVALNLAVSQLATINARPVVENIASAASINVAADTDVIVISGTTTITSVATPSVYRTYIVHYPAGSGIVFLGVNMAAGDAILIIGTP